MGYNTWQMNEFNPAHHALLFAWIAREALQRAGASRGAAAIRQAVRRYGEQRGRRMAQRARRDGRAPDMTSFLAYGEWQAAPELFETALESRAAGARSRVYRCPWHQAWLEHGVNEFGRLYCLEIDSALARGFNPALRLEVNGTRSNGADFCEFIYPAADLEALAALQVDRSRTVMGWSYHLGHLYQTLHRVLSEELGEAGAAAAQAGLAEFARRFGEAAAAEVRSYLERDFDRAEQA